MRIGFFSDSYFPEIDGVTYTLDSWKERLEERGHEVYIIYPESESYDSGRREIPVRSVTNPFYEGYNIPLPLFQDLPDLDVVHCHSPAPVGWLGRLYSMRNNVPSVYTHHTPIEEYFVQAVKLESLANLMKKVYVPLEEKFLSTFDKVITNTEKGRRNVSSVKIDAGIDMRFFQESNTDTREEEVIGYSGRISNEKNLEEVVEMSQEIDAKLVVVGEGPAREEIEAEAPEDTVFKDFLPRKKLPHHYSKLDVFITASTGDTLGLSPLEANACGTPVVAPDVHPFDKTIEPGNGLKYEKGNIQDFREKVRTALNQKWQTRKAVQKYSLKASIDQIEKIYENLDGKKQ
ncbi:glycosyltransferase [Candidatus Nanohalobium constans]|uniref:Glycosyl transferase group 1 n=1 Tax=Candidatus Nanohalobium constans TaxID=2565781 RepID=A0A5Q0UEY6_9ARCH|nr:glycosyltransferase [Candidatus Nanohalobium constans]QGA80152.1 glycosyl transferase group 1 [Candidatus Nanohalobium constans]